MDVTRRMIDLVDIGRGLMDLLGHENRALRDNDTRRVRDLLERKVELIRAFETRFEGLSKHATPAEIASVEPSLRDDLRSIGTTIEELVNENSKRLLVAIEVHRRVVDGIASAVRTVQSGPGTYSPSGAVGKGPRGGKRAMAFSYDQAL